MALTKKQKYDRCYEAAAMIKASIDGMKAAGLINHRTKEVFSGMIAEWIFRCPKERSGLISLAALGSNKIADDHYFGRKSSGLVVFEQVINGASVRRIACVIRSRCRTHVVTPAENTLLKKYQEKTYKIKSKTDIEAEYEYAGIELVTRTRKPHKK